jgi:hypothetical protein
MSLTMFKEVNYTLSKLLKDIEMGEIGLPEIQRPFVWPNIKVRDLFDSMYRGFPVGYFLFWANGAGEGHRQIGVEEHQKAPRLLIVDGQQRLTSLFAVIHGVSVLRENYQQEKIMISFNPLTEKFAVADVTTKRNPEYIPDISVVWSDKTDIFELADSYLLQLKASREVTPEEYKKIKKAINNLDNIQEYPFTVLEISGNATEEQMADIFVRVNSKGTPLNQADFILTLMSVFWDEGRHELEHFCRDSRIAPVSGPSPFNYYLQPDPDQLLRVDVGVAFRRARLRFVYNILRGKDMETGEFSDERREIQFKALQAAQEKMLNIQNWHDFLLTIRRAGFTGQSMIISVTSILYAYVFYLIGKYDYKVEAFQLRNVIARWFFFNSLTSRYASGAETTMEEDLSKIEKVKTADEFVKQLNKTIDDTLTEDYWKIGLPNDLATSSPRSPSLFSYYASLNLLHSRVLFSDLLVSDLLDPASKAKKSAVERHHLFPKEHLARLNITELRETNQIANFALIEWNDNIAIQDDPPPTYFPKYINRFKNDSGLKEMLRVHALPQDWQNMDYFKFLEVRRKLIAEIIREGFAELSSKSDE